MYPTSTPASLLEERERSVCNRFPTNYSVLRFFQFLNQLLFVLYLGILFDRSIPLRLLKPPFSPFSLPFSFTIFRQDTYAKPKLATYRLDWLRWALIDLTSFNSSAPTFLSRSPTIPRAEILQEIKVDLIVMWVFNSSVIYYVHCTHAIFKGWMIGLWYQ